MLRSLDYECVALAYPVKQSNFYHLLEMNWLRINIRAPNNQQGMVAVRTVFNKLSAFEYDNIELMILDHGFVSSSYFVNRLNADINHKRSMF